MRFVRRDDVHHDAVRREHLRKGVARNGRARDQHATDPRLLQFIQIYQTSPAVRERIRASYANNDKFYSLPWLAKPL